jgi:hypothetical protein
MPRKSKQIRHFKVPNGLNFIKEQIRIAHANYHQDAFEYYFRLYRMKGGSFTKEQILKQKA